MYVSLTDEKFERKGFEETRDTCLQSTWDLESLGAK